MKKKISLNILLSYPVYWDDYRVLRDFVQNFYDAKGANDWWRDFYYSYKEESLAMGLKNSVFSYEWLLHIGASNKSQEKGAAGYFGEGFKIAALCAVRDLKWKVTMRSGDWELKVIIEPITIDGQEKQELAYNIKECGQGTESVLKLKNVTEQQFHIFEDVLKSFFYPENPLLANKLFDDHEAAVYTRSELPHPKHLPFTSEFGTKGIVFGRFQALGTVPFPLAVALHTYQQKDRERNSLYDFDVIKLMYDIASRLDAPAAKNVLIHLRQSWNAYPTRNVDIHTWYYVICELIRRVAASKETCQEFQQEFPRLLYGERLLAEDVHWSNRRRLAKVWLKNQIPQYILVQSKFRLLGVPELEVACEAAGGFTMDDDPRGSEINYLMVLKEMTAEIFGSFFPDYDQTECKIIRNGSAVYSGTANTQKRRDVITNSHGLTVKQKLYSIAIKEKYLSKDFFAMAASTYFHELSHMFGGDASAGFSLALTYVIQILVENDSLIAIYRKRWEAVCSHGFHSNMVNSLLQR